jgi:glycerophosphoryl diester phosphodiesterase
MKNIRKQFKRIRDKEFVPMVLMALLMLSITRGVKLLGIRDLSPSNDVAIGAAGVRQALPTRKPNLDILKVGHRGTRVYAPENTLPAIQKAIELGYDYVELDVQYSKDGVPVIMHDGSMIRTTNRFDILARLSLKDIEKADAGSWFDKKFAGTRVPTLEQCLQAMQGKIKLYMDQKAAPQPAAVKLLKEYKFYPDDMIVVGDNQMQKEFLKLEPAAPVMPYVTSMADIDKVLKEFADPKAFNTDCDKVTQEMVDKAHALGIMVFSNVLVIPPDKERDCMKWVIDIGADAIQIDHPELLNSLLDEMRKGAKK